MGCHSFTRRQRRRLKDLQGPLSQLLDLVFDLAQRRRTPWLRKPAVVDLLLLAHSTHFLPGVPRIFHAGNVILPAVVGERRYELVQLSPPRRRYTPTRDIGVPTIRDPTIDVHHRRRLPWQACHGRVDARHARQVAAHSWIAERARAREQREPSQATKRLHHYQAGRRGQSRARLSGNGAITSQTLSKNPRSLQSRKQTTGYPRVRVSRPKVLALQRAVLAEHRWRRRRRRRSRRRPTRLRR